MEITTDIYLGDSKDQLKQLPVNSIDLVVTSPPYADQRKNTYGGIRHDEYVEWFLPISEQLLRILKPTGTFVLNIKEKVVNGERSTYVMELILEMRKQAGCGRKNLFGIKKIATRVNGLTVFVIPGKGCCNSIKIGNLLCIRKKSWCQWAIGLIQD